MKEKLTQLNMMFLGNWNACYDAIRNKILIAPKQIMNPFMPDLNHVHAIHEPEFPEKVKDVISPPFVLHFSGNWDLINRRLFGIHGKIHLDQIQNLVPGSDRCLIMTSSDYNEYIAQALLERDINHIVVFDQKLDQEVICPHHQLFISEYGTKIINPSVGQEASRIVMGLAQKNIFVNDALVTLRTVNHFEQYDPHLAVLSTNKEDIHKTQYSSKSYTLSRIELVHDLKSWFF